MPDIIKPPPAPKDKVLCENTCPVCRTRARWYWRDRVWTEGRAAYGCDQVFGKCPGCETSIYLGAYSDFRRRRARVIAGMV